MNHRGKNPFQGRCEIVGVEGGISLVAELVVLEHFFRRTLVFPSIIWIGYASFVLWLKFLGDKGRG